MADQSFQNHSMMVPLYHYVGTPLVVVCLAVFGREVARAPSAANVGLVLLTVAVGIAAFYARVFALGVQDRVIRLEEQLRMARVLPDDLRGRIDEFSTTQLIGMRFASDAELPDLARRVLAGEFATRKEIKAAVRDWRADHDRV